MFLHLSQRLNIELWISQINHTLFHADNKIVNQITTNPLYHEHTKYIEFNYHYTRDVFTCVIKLPCVNTKLRTADDIIDSFTHQTKTQVS